MIDLTTTELIVLSWMCEGLTPNQIARKLCRSTATVREHEWRLRQKLGAKHRTEAVVIAYRSRLRVMPATEQPTPRPEAART